MHINKFIYILLTCVISIAMLGIAISDKKSYKTQSNQILEVRNQIRVIDGDTFELNDKKIRLYGVDAFEKGQKCYKHNDEFDCGKLSSEYLTFLLTGKNIECAHQSYDRYSRSISICKVDGIDVSKMMVKQGWAKAYRKYASDYIQDEEFAQKEKLGAWAKEFISPDKQRSNTK